MLDALLYSAAPNPDEARKGRLLNGMLLSMAGLVVFYLVVAWMFSATMRITASIPITLVMIVGLYFLNRRGAVALSAGLLTIGLGLIFTTASLFPASKPGSLSGILTPLLLTIPVGLAGVILSWRWVPIIAGLFVVDIGWLYSGGMPQMAAYRAQHPEDAASFIAIGMISIIATAVLSYLSSRQVEQTLAQFRQQNAALAAVNRELAAQSQHEHAVGAGINTLAVQLSAVTDRQTREITAQSAQITEVAGSVTQIHSAANQIATLAGAVNSAAEDALAAVQRAQEIVGQNRAAVERSRAQAAQVSTRMLALGQSTARMTTFVNGLGDLADETRLLALNATIEAAGAGAFGRRFGVVAAEVQDLSHRSAAIVDQIHQVIADLHAAAAEALTATAGSQAAADEADTLADTVRGVQDQVLAAVHQTGILVHQISIATAQQTNATEAMSHTMRDIAQAAHTTSEDTRTLERVVHDLTRSAGLLNSAMARLHPRELAQPPP